MAAEFAKEYCGALAAIRSGRYHPGIRDWAGYLRHHDRIPQRKRGYWTKEIVDSTFDAIVKTLGHVPSRRELGKIEKWDLLNAIDVGYGGEKGYSNYLLSRGYVPHDPTKKESPWTREAIDGAFNQHHQELGRTPLCHEFRKRFPGAVRALKRGACGPNAKTYVRYLIQKGIAPPTPWISGKWTPEAIDTAFDKLHSRLGRLPLLGEFRAICSGGYRAVEKGRYHSTVHNYGDYLRHRGFRENSDVEISKVLFEFGRQEI